MHGTTIRMLGIFIFCSGCSVSSLVTAPSKTYQPADAAKQPWTIGGTFDQRKDLLTVTINGDNVMIGRFPPYTPRLNLSGLYQGHHLNADCEFTVGIIRNRIAETVFQTVRNKSGNTCEILVDAKPATTLYF